MTGLTATTRTLTATLERPFTIARGTTESVTIVEVCIEDDDGNVGLGACTPTAYYGETPETVTAVLPEYLPVVESVGDPHALTAIERACRDRVAPNPAALAAVTTALVDLAATRATLPLYRYWGLEPAAAPETAVTVGIDEPAAMGAVAASVVDSGVSTIKVKLGTDRDVDRLEAVRDAAPDATLYADANGAWGPVEAVELIEALESYNLSIVEQPVSGEDLAGLRYVHERSPVPVVADESCMTARDVPGLAGRCSGVNVKLMKCGGPLEAIRLVHVARAHGLSVLGGCMVESSASIATACHLAPLFDHADLDGALLLADDPHEGVPVEGGTIALESLDRPGSGARPRQQGL